MVTLTTEAKPRRTSVFHEVGLHEGRDDSVSSLERPRLNVRFRTRESVIDDDADKDESQKYADSDVIEDSDSPEDSNIPPKMVRSQRNPIQRFSLFLLMIAIAIPLLQLAPFTKKNNLPPLTATGVPFSEEPSDSKHISKRQNSPTDICKRWSQQSAVVNGTLYLYGGRATTSSDQTSNEWNNNFLTLDLTHSWEISNPSLTGLPQPSGPPAVANGYLWNSFDSVYLYGGEFSDTPVETPVAFALWQYNIPSSSWNQISNPKTSSGQNSEPAGESIQRAAEGAGYAVPNLGKGWYFGGHEDWATTQGWSNQIDRIYLSSFVEYTYPGYSSGDGQSAGSDGLWRNITSGGIQTTAGFTDRADGLLVYVPGFGAQGILISLAGGTNDTFTQMNEMNVYDIAASEWYNQATSGPTPKIRVNPCAVVAAAPDGSSYNVYMFGGQDLVPYENQTQYDDMWILSVPSFTWIQVNQDNQSTPYARAGHTCNVWDGQMVVVGGYIGTDISCESPGIYVFNLTSLQWQNQFTALSGPQSPTGSFILETYNPLSQQQNQRGTNESAGIQGSYGYEVPPVVYSAIGGDAAGGATITAPVQSPTSGPLASGKPQTYTVTTTNAAGAIVTETGVFNGNINSSQTTSSAARKGAISAGVVAFALLILASYLGFCAFVYRKQLKMYKAHVALAHEAGADPSRGEKVAHVPGSTGAGYTDSGASRPPLNAPHPDSFWAMYRQSSDSQGQSSWSGAGPAHGHTRQQDSIGGTTSSSGGQGLTPSVAASSTDDLLSGQEPSFVGVMLHPRRSLRVINRD